MTTLEPDLCRICKRPLDHRDSVTYGFRHEDCWATFVGANYNYRSGLFRETELLIATTDRQAFSTLWND